MLEVNLKKFRNLSIYQIFLWLSNFMINDILTDILQSSDFKQYGKLVTILPVIGLKKPLWPYMNVWHINRSPVCNSIVWVVIAVWLFKNTAGLLTSAIMLYTIQRTLFVFRYFRIFWMILSFIWIVLSTLLKSILDVWYKLNDFKLSS